MLSDCADGGEHEALPFLLIVVAIVNKKHILLGFPELSLMALATQAGRTIANQDYPSSILHGLGSQVRRKRNMPITGNSLLLRHTIGPSIQVPLNPTRSCSPGFPSGLFFLHSPTWERKRIEPGTFCTGPVCFIPQLQFRLQLFNTIKERIYAQQNSTARASCLGIKNPFFFSFILYVQHLRIHSTSVEHPCCMFSTYSIFKKWCVDHTHKL